MTRHKPAQEVADIKRLAAEIADESDSDILLINSPFEVDTDSKVFRLVKPRSRRRNVTFFLVSEGGNADAAYKVARCLQKNYTRVTAFVHGYCKSAGTLCVLGAHDLIMSDSGELGPLDVQIAKKDELGERSSGLVAGEALASIKSKAFDMYEDFFLQILERSSNLVTFKTASDIALRMTVGLLEPLYAQINPVEVGEMARSMRVANDYGRRLGLYSKNLEDDALELLCQTYPSHGFVIDCDEATSLFRRVRGPTEQEALLASMLGTVAQDPASKPLIAFLNAELPRSHDEPIEYTEGTELAAAADAAAAAIDAASAEGATPAGEAG
jgi:hypothetical protein